MVWDWSHAPEAYDNARKQLDAKGREWLEMVYAEWRSAQGKRGNVYTGSQNFDERKYDRALKYAKGLSEDQMREFIWEKAESLRYCTNGGFGAWACPFGCVVHLLPFDAPDGAEHDDE